MKRIIIILMILCLMLADLMPTAYAYEHHTGKSDMQTSFTPAVSKFKTATTEVHRNPIYEGVDDDSAVVLPEPQLPQAGISSTDPADYVTEEEAAAQLRQAMVDRQETCVLQVASENTDHDWLMSILFGNAISHTGNPVEGDYIRWHYCAWQANSNYYTEGNSTYYTSTFTLSYYTTTEQEEELNVAVEELLESLSLYEATDYEKIKGIYDYICANVTYDYDNLEDTTYMRKHTAYAALIDGTAVCQGYASLLYRLALALGVDCRVIAGLGGCFLEMFEDYERHGWNIVCLDGKYYNLDATWDAGNEIYSWFLCSDETFFGNIMERHIRDSEFDSESFHLLYPMSVDDYSQEIISGFCGADGDNLTWMLNNDVLTISGTGMMADFSVLESPWQGAHSKIKEVVIEEGVASIGSCAFYWLGNVKKVVLPQSLRQIGWNAFGNCISLPEITIPNQVSVIGNSCFGTCYELATVTLPESLKEIPELCFVGCSSLKIITIPSSVEEIGEMAFSNTSLETISFPEALKRIGKEAFSGSDLAEVYIPETVEEIGGGAFSGRFIQDILVSDANKYYADVDGILFSKDLLSLVSYPGGKTNTSYTIPDGTVHIGESAFWDAWFLGNITFADSVQTIGRRAFSTCRIKEYVLPDSLISVGEEAFHNNLILESIYIPGSVSYGDRVFSGCGIKNIVFSDELTEIPVGMFAGCPLTEIVLPDSIKVIGDNAFFVCDQLMSVTISSSVETIGECAFMLCKRLNNLTIGYGVNEIGQQAFEGCESLEDVFYCGTEERWGFVDVGTQNDELLQSTMHFADEVDHEHVFSADMLDLKEPTCSQTGLRGTICLYCGYLICSEEIEKLPHTDIISWTYEPPTCAAEGYTTYTCACGESFHADFIPVLDHTEETIPGKAPTCTETGLTEGKKCSVCGEIITAQQTIPALGHDFYLGTCVRCGETDPDYCDGINHHYIVSSVTRPTCTEKGYTTYVCSCGDTYDGDFVDPMGHTPVGSHTVIKYPNCVEDGLSSEVYCSVCEQYVNLAFPAFGHNYENGTCSRCGEADPDYVAPEKPTDPVDPEEPAIDGVIRIAGDDRIATSLMLADQLKEVLDVDKFDAVIVASALNFPDALTGSYLAAEKNAPILLTYPAAHAKIRAYIQENLKPGGTVYILGGEGAVSADFANGLNGFNVKRLAGSDRFGTNLAIMEEAGVSADQPVLIATAVNFADSLSASAAGLPMVLVYGSLREDQKEFLATTSRNFIIIGGEAAVSKSLENELAAIGSVTRVAGSSRYETSVLVAEQFVQNPDAVILAYARNFPDGLCGGPLAYALGAPLILTDNSGYSTADTYVSGISAGIVVGGTGLISDETANQIFDK